MLPDNILFSNDPASDLRVFLARKRYSGVIVLTDENTKKNCYPLISGGLDAHQVIEVQSGEERKNLDSCIAIWDKLTTATIDRHGCIVVLGGGVLGDMGGFCASTYKRGIDFILVPTTLLAQSDASIGGKLGIDFNNFKNHIGVFQQPALTLLSSAFLKTLPTNELRSGFAEVIKHALIADKPMFEKICDNNLGQQPWDVLIRHSVEFKARVTTEDPTEKGLRKILNAGHTIGHALETHLMNEGNRILHGEAIAVGLIAEAYVANAKGLLNTQDLQRITTYIISIFGRVNIDPGVTDGVCKLVVQDKKNKGSKILCVLLNSIGDAKWDYEISLEDVKAGLEFYQAS